MTCTTELFRKLLPVTVNVKVAPPVTTEGGLMLVIVGTLWALQVTQIPAHTTMKRDTRDGPRHWMDEAIEENIDTISRGQGTSTVMCESKHSGVT